MNDVRHHDIWRRLNTPVLRLGLAMSVAIGLVSGGHLGAQAGQQELDPAQEYRPPSKPAFHLNRMIERLEQGYVALGGVEYQMIDQQHSAIDMVGLRKTVADILNKKNEKGQPILAPIVRVTPEGDNVESSSWVIEQV